MFEEVDTKKSLKLPENIFMNKLDHLMNSL